MVRLRVLGFYSQLVFVKSLYQRKLHTHITFYGFWVFLKSDTPSYNLIHIFLGFWFFYGNDV